MSQYCIKPHPDFNIENFPYVVAAGKHYFLWINVKENLVNEFIYTGRSLQLNSDAFFFKKTKYGYSLHFAQDSMSDENRQAFMWLEMQLKYDFN